jgi:hypothetical protein
LYATYFEFKYKSENFIDFKSHVQSMSWLGPHKPSAKTLPAHVSHYKGLRGQFAKAADQLFEQGLDLVVGQVR